IPGVILITGGGLLTAIYGHIPIIHTGWIFWSLILFSISGVAFAWKVAPLQKRIYQMTSNQGSSDKFNWIIFKKMYLAWEIWGLIALLTPVTALVMMTLKFPQ